MYNQDADAFIFPDVIGALKKRGYDCPFGFVLRPEIAPDKIERNNRRQKTETVKVKSACHAQAGDGESGQDRSEDSGSAEDRGVYGNCVGEVFFGYNLRKKRLTGQTVKRHYQAGKSGNQGNLPEGNYLQGDEYGQRESDYP